jgi:hypothetical protein
MVAAAVRMRKTQQRRRRNLSRPALAHFSKKIKVVAQLSHSPTKMIITHLINNSCILLTSPHSMTLKR